MKNFKQLLIAIGLVTFAGSASAVGITGSIGFNGEYTIDTTDLATATMITRVDASVDGAVTGSFADEGIAHGDVPSYSNFTFDPTGPVNDIWSIAGFTFDLETMVNSFQDSTFLLLKGTGVISHADYDDTIGEWAFSAQTSDASFTWSSSSSAAPEPAITLLLATGLIGFGVTRRMRKKA